MLVKLVANVQGLVRRSTLNGKSHLVVPLVMGTEDVLTGSNGSGFYPGQEWAKSVPSWNHKPIVVYHPELNGAPTTAADPVVLNTRGIGILLNTKWDTKQRAEAWLDEEKTNQVDKRIIPAIEAGTIMEVSTGLFVNQDKTPGEFNGKKYDWVARDHQPDHLAILPDQIGACSVAMGAGLLQVNSAKFHPEGTLTVLQRSIVEAVAGIGLRLVDNALSFDATTGQLSDLLSGKYGKPGQYWDGWVVDVFPDRVIFRDNGKLWSQAYSASENSVALTGSAVEVVRVSEYKEAAGVTANSDPTKEKTMAFDRKAHLATLIGNGGYTEADRPSLEALTDDVLGRIRPVGVVPTPTPAVTVPTPAPVVGNTQSAEQFIASAPPAIQAVLRQGLTAVTNRKKELIAAITANANNPFTPAFLETKEPEELEGIAKLAGIGQSPSPTANGMFLPGYQVPQMGGIVPNFGGAVGGLPTNNAAVPTETLVAPSLTFNRGK